MRFDVLMVIAVHSLLCVLPSDLYAEESVENVVLITLDGLRSEEVFSGADGRLMIPELGVKDPAPWLERYGGDTPEERRRRLLPFLWARIEEKKAWIAGSLDTDSNVKVTNGRYFSYPGYNELLCGFGDTEIDSNDKQYNQNTTVLEFLNNQPEYVGSVQAFCSWDVFPFIINDERSHIPVNAGWMPVTSGDEKRLGVLNNVSENLFREWESVRYDVITSSAAIECLRHERPRVLYVSLGETDDWAHAGRYDRYLLTAEQNDRFIQQIWAATQEIPQYRDKTAFLVSTDHGRGDGREGWKSHGVNYPGSDRIWIAAFGPGFSVSGIDQGGDFTQSQIAATVAQLLGYDFTQLDPRIANALDILVFRPN